MFTYKVEIAVNPKKTGEFLEFFLSIANEIKGDNGYRSLQLYMHRDHAYNYALLSDWESEESMENHLRGDNFSLLKGGAIVLGQNFNVIIGESATIDHSRWKKMNLHW